MKATSQKRQPQKMKKEDDLKKMKSEQLLKNEDDLRKMREKKRPK